MKEIAKRDEIVVKGHIGTWYVIDEAEYDGRMLYLLEHEEYGDEAAGVIIDADGNLVLQDVWNGFLDYEEAFGSEDAGLYIISMGDGQQ